MTVPPKPTLVPEETEKKTPSLLGVTGVQRFQENVATKLDATQKEIAKEEARPIDDKAERSIREARSFVENWQSAPKPMDHRKEDARAFFGKVVIVLFAVCIGAFALIGCVLAVFSDEAHVKNLLSVMQTIGALLTWGVGFVMGHYFTNHNKE
ncbi:MAG: hypothetical protein PHW63_03385 [Alphaproteobacteria bacterium]|nr:hypothetical protein [Alphaproteobacteria bacterium]